MRALTMMMIDHLDLFNAYINMPHIFFFFFMIEMCGMRAHINRARAHIFSHHIYKRARGSIYLLFQNKRIKRERAYLY